MKPAERNKEKQDVLRELAEFAQDPHRDRLLEKFKTCPEARQLSELLGSALAGRKVYSRHLTSARLLPVPPGMVHPG
jgi:hypothetical protein